MKEEANILPLVTIIIPTYNRYYYIGATLDSLRKQSYVNWECIVVDDGSQDYTQELLDFYCRIESRIKYVRRPHNMPKGANACRNYGFTISKGIYINWFDDDDIMLENFILDKYSRFNNRTDLVICSFSRTDHNLRHPEKVDLNISYSLFKSYAIYELKIITHSIMFKKDFLKGKKLFNTDIVWGEETEFYLRLFFDLPKLNYVIIDKPLLLYRQHEKSKSSENRKFIKEYRLSLIKIALANLKRGLVLKDRQISVFFYKELMSAFFRSLHQGYKELAKYILVNILPLVRQLNKRLSYELFIFGYILIALDRSIFKLEKRFKNYLD